MENVTGADLYNHTLTGDISMTLCCERSDPHHIPCVIVSNGTNRINGRPSDNKGNVRDRHSLYT